MSAPGELGPRRAALAAGAVVLGTALVYGGALGHPLLASHDDGPYVLWNPVVRAPLGAAIRGAFTTHVMGAWAPLHVLSHALDHRLFGEWAGGSVLVNAALHAAAAALVGGLVLRLGGRWVAALAAAVIFAVHPVQVEAVAWISQRKTVLSAVFLLLSLHAWVGYARAAPGRRRGPWALSLAAGSCALLTKAVAVVLPLATIAVDHALGRVRAGRAWVVEKLPLGLAAAGVAWITVLLKGEVSSGVTVLGHTRTAGAGGLAWHGGSPLATALTVATIVPRYLRLLLWPAGLSAVYAPPVHTGLDAEVVASLALLAGLGALGIALARRAPRLACWYALSLVGLLPVSQLAPQVTLMNDRYLYVPMIGLAALAGEGLCAGLRAAAGRGRALAAGLAGAAVAAALALTGVAHARVEVWGSDLALWRDAAAKAPGSPYAWYNLGASLEAAGEGEAAMAAYRRACALDPQEGEAAVNLGALLLRRGSLAEADPFLERGARLLPGSLEAAFDLGLLRFLQGRPREGEGPLLAALAQAPAGPRRCTVEALLGHVLTLSDRPEEALLRYGAAAVEGCADAEVGLYRAYALSQRGREGEALAGVAAAVAAGAPLGRAFLARPTLAPLRARPGFEALLQRYAAGARPASATP